MNLGYGRRMGVNTMHLRPFLVDFQSFIYTVCTNPSCELCIVHISLILLHQLRTLVLLHTQYRVRST